MIHNKTLLFILMFNEEVINVIYLPLQNRRVARSGLLFSSISLDRMSQKEMQADHKAKNTQNKTLHRHSKMHV